MMQKTAQWLRSYMDKPMAEENVGARAPNATPQPLLKSDRALSSALMGHDTVSRPRESSTAKTASSLVKHLRNIGSCLLILGFGNWPPHYTCQVHSIHNQYLRTKFESQFWAILADAPTSTETEKWWWNSLVGWAVSRSNYREWTQYNWWGTLVMVNLAQHFSSRHSRQNFGYWLPLLGFANNDYFPPTGCAVFATDTLQRHKPTDAKKD